ncbi:transposase family protein [Micromonospora sediminimaris]|uniref:transposase family protein n=1 Tax=Micromonospora sediminimaris TaxID=547162 RepID=UPI0037AD8E06
MVNDTTRLLGLDGLVAERVELDAADIPVVDLSTGCEQARCCPGCGQRAVRVKQWTTTRPRDLPVGGRAVRLRWRKRRWYCPTPACPRKSFTEQVAQVPARARLTTRLREAAGAAVADAGRTIVQTARDHDVSWPVVADAFTTHATAVLPAEPITRPRYRPKLPMSGAGHSRSEGVSLGSLNEAGSTPERIGPRREDGSMHVVNGILKANAAYLAGPDGPRRGAAYGLYRLGVKYLTPTLPHARPTATRPGWPGHKEHQRDAGRIAVRCGGDPDVRLCPRLPPENSWQRLTINGSR